MKPTRPKRLVEILAPEAFPPEPDPADLGALLRAAVADYRARHNLSERAVAALCEMAPGNFHAAIRRRGVRVETLERVCRGLGLRVALLPAIP